MEFKRSLGIVYFHPCTSFSPPSEPAGSGAMGLSPHSTSESFGRRLAGLESVPSSIPPESGRADPLRNHSSVN